MEDEALETSSGSQLVPTSLAVLAIVLGAAGLYFGLTANQRLNPLSESMEVGTSSDARLEKKVATLETQLTELGVQYAELKKALERMRLYSNQSEKLVKQVAGAVSENRDEIVKLAERVNEFASGGAKTKRSPSAESADLGSGPGGTYTIESGDSFAKIAAKLNLDLQALLDANPGADPRRLRIGQVINIPGS
ncbi:MAG: LysM peptidoglycan-binding domain-containing protein [Opitutales bacterium]